MTIDEFAEKHGLSQRSVLCMKRIGCDTVEKMLRKLPTAYDMLRVENLGRKNAISIMKALISEGYEEYKDASWDEETKERDWIEKTKKGLEKASLKPSLTQEQYDYWHDRVNGLFRRGYLSEQEKKDFINAMYNLSDLINKGVNDMTYDGQCEDWDVKDSRRLPTLEKSSTLSD